MKKIKPVKKTKIIKKEYWYCGLDEPGHEHLKKETAQACIDRQSILKANKNIEKEIISLCLSGLDKHTVANRVGVYCGIVTKVWRDYRTQKLANDLLKNILKSKKAKELTAGDIEPCFSVRTANCLKNARLLDVSLFDIANIPEKEILGTKNFGKKSYKELLTVINQAIGADE